MKYKLVAFDLDGTLTMSEPSWVMIHRKFNTLDVGAEGERLYSQGLISYRQFMLKDIAAWPSPLAKKAVWEALRGYQLRPEAKLVVSSLRDRGVKTALLTAALDLMAEDAAKKLGIDYVFSNSIEFDSRGYFNGRVYARVEPLRKHAVLKQLLARLNIEREYCAAVGDTVYDVSFLKEAGRGFLLGNKELAKNNGLIHIRRLDEILEHL